MTGPIDVSVTAGARERLVSHTHEGGPGGPDGVDGPDAAELARRFSASARTSMPRAPLYAALAEGISRDRGLCALLLDAPPTQRLPVLLFAATHSLLLDEPDHPLAEWYPNLTAEPRSPRDAALLPTFATFVDERNDRLRALLATRSTQTNEVGRCALLLPAFSMLDEEVGPLGHLDVGASAGLNLLLDRFEYRYRDTDGTTRSVGGHSRVAIDVSTRGAVPIPGRMPRIDAGCGLDARPIDVRDTDQARWLEACVWPDQADRFHRLRQAIAIARADPPELVTGDAVDDLAAGVERVGHSAHPVVTNSWVLNYLTGDERTAYLAELDRLGASRDLSWVYAEAPALIPELPTGPDPADPQRTVLSLARWRNGRRTVAHLATCHPHGFWIHWR